MAKDVLASVRAHDEAHGTWLPARVGGKIRSRVIAPPGGGWHAMISTGFDSMPRSNVLSGDRALQSQPASIKLCYRFDVWATGGNKLMSADVKQDDLALISFKPGDWPQRLVGIN